MASGRSTVFISKRNQGRMVRGKQLTDMATTQKINLSVLQRMDPDVVDVLVKAGHVTLYDFDTQTKTWARKQVEGALFVVQRKSAPEFQFCVLNRLSTENVVEDLQEDFSYEVSEPYLLYRNKEGQVIGVWFYEKRELAAVVDFLQRTAGKAVSVATPVEPTKVVAAPPVKHVREEERAQAVGSDIMRLLSQAKVVAEPEKGPAQEEATPLSPIKPTPTPATGTSPKLLTPSFFSAAQGTSSTAKLTKEKLRSAMQRLVKNDQFIEMLYKELMES